MLLVQVLLHSRRSVSEARRRQQDKIKWHNVTITPQNRLLCEIMGCGEGTDPAKVNSWSQVLLVSVSFERKHKCVSFNCM